MAKLAVPDEVYNWLVNFFDVHSHCTHYRRELSIYDVCNYSQHYSRFQYRTTIIRSQHRRPKTNHAR